MHNIQIPDEQFQRLFTLAQAAGYRDVDAFIASFMDEPVDDPRATISEEQLRANVAAMEYGEADIKAGRGVDMKDAIQEIAKKHGLNITQ